MKIIGKTEGGFIATVSNEEINALLAVNDCRKGKVKEEIKVGNDLSFTVSLQNLNLIKDITLSGSYTTLSELSRAHIMLGEAINKIQALQTPLLEVKQIIKTGQA